MRLVKISRGLCLLVLALLGSLLVLSSAWGGVGATIALPLNPAKPTVNGLALSLDCQWVSGPGYRPLRIDITCTPAATGDRTLDVELRVGLGLNRHSLTLRTEIEIPAGSNKLSKLISAPQLSTMQFLSLDVWEDGVHLDDLSIKDHFINSGGLGWNWGDQPRILFVTSSPIDISECSFMAQTNQVGSNTPALSSVAQTDNFIESPAAGLEENWINYSSLDLIFLSLEDARFLAAKPQVWQALCRWTWAGGNLCVFGVGEDWQGLPALETLLSCPPSDQEAAAPLRGWQRPDRELFDKPAQVSNIPANNLPYNVRAARGNINIQKPPKKDQSPPEKDPFVLKKARLGLMVAIGSQKPFPGESAQWEWMFNVISPQRYPWQARHGVSPGEENPSFDDFLIADIGLPPIRTYRVLITLFVVLIGPVNYWWLRRKGRLHLLLFTVPASALLTSGLLIGYALAADGFEARLRARSFTFLDQRRHEAVSWARLSYYTGLASSSGLHFPDDTVLIPLEKDASNGPFGGKTRHMIWSDHQHLTRGWLGSRTPTQYVTLRAYDNPRELTILPAADDPLRRTVKNQLGVKIKRLIVRDEQGKFHLGKEIDAAKQQALALLDSEEARQTALNDTIFMVSQNPPMFPSQVTGNNRRGFFTPVSSARRAWTNSAAVSDSTSLLELELTRLRGELMAGTMAPRTYIAVVERPQEIVVGMDGLTETQSMHVIQASW